MQYLKQTIEDFTSSTITQLYADYNPATEYTFESNDLALTNASVVRYGNYYWRSTTVNNQGNTPFEGSLQWVILSVSNKHAMLDPQSQTKTEETGADIVVKFDRNLMTTLGIGNFEAEEIIVEQLDDLDAVLATQTFTYSVNEDVYDYWDYENSPYSLEVNRNIKVDLALLGTQVRITLKRITSTDKVSCGFLYGGEPVDMGNTLINVDFGDYSYITEGTLNTLGFATTKKSAVSVPVSFQTKISETLQPYVRRRVQELKQEDETVLFIVDPTEESIFENMLVLGKIQDSSHSVGEYREIIISWSVYSTP